MENEEKIKIIKTEDYDFQPTKRKGIKATKLIGPGESGSQNVVVVDLGMDAIVEDHKIEQCESIYVLQGAVELEYDEQKEFLLTGDLVYFPSGTSHKLIPLRTPCRLMLIFSG